MLIVTRAAPSFFCTAPHRCGTISVLDYRFDQVEIPHFVQEIQDHNFRDWALVFGVLKIDVLK